MTTAEAIIRVLQARGLTVVRQADTTFGSDEQDIKFANEVDDLLERNNATTANDVWSPAHQVRQ